MADTTTENAMKDLLQAAAQAPFRIAPEKRQKLISEIFKGEVWNITGANGKANFFAVPEDREVILKYSGLASLWCTTYAAIHIMDLASRRRRESSSNECNAIDLSVGLGQLRVLEHMNYAKALFDRDKPWPNLLSIPNTEADSESLEGKINELFLGALSWIIFHEIGHINYRDSPFVPNSIAVQQEFKADVFATSWILEEAGNGIEKEFRILAISIGLVWLFLCEDKRGVGDTHPPTILRFREVVQQFQAQERSLGLENAFYVFKAFFDPTSIQNGLDSPKQAFESISKKMEDLYSQTR